MPAGGAITTAIIGLGTAGYKAYQAHQQQKKADELRLQDSSTPEEREQLAMSRQAAGTSRLLGMGGMQNRLGMVQAGALQNARLGAASGADFLAAAGAAA
ncbi:hypothetical protein, partial [Hymenobacter agri]